MGFSFNDWNSTEIDEIFDQLFYMQWLRPENVMWDLPAVLLTAPHIRQDIKKVEIGIGNGCSSFTVLGGTFKKEYDWYYNVNLDGYWDNSDIYDHYSGNNLKKFIEKAPDTQFEIAFDHKENLLKQAKEIGATKGYQVVDANNPIKLPDVKLVYSNMLYWLDDYETVLANIADQLETGSKIITVFPSSKFQSYNRSYAQENQFWKLINRGRADVHMHPVDILDMEKRIAPKCNLKLVEATSYLSKETLNIHDIGLRPFSPALIKMANYMSPEQRMEVKEEWCEGFRPILQELVNQELHTGHNDGGFNFFCLEKI